MEEAEELWDWNKYLERQLKEDAREVGRITAEAITRGSVQGEDKLTGLIEIPRELNTPTDHEFYWTNNIPKKTGHKNQLNNKVWRSKSFLFSCRVRCQECMGST
jgi:hypothetical protein